MSFNGSNFDPLTQSFTLLLSDGTPVYILPTDVDYFYYYNVASCINYGAQAGACFMMLFVVAILTKSSKRKSLLFVLNLLSLAFGFLRALLFALYFTSAWNEFYASFTLDFSRVPKAAYATSVAGSVIPLLMTITVNMSLFLQAYTVCKGLDDIYRYSMTIVSGIVALLAISFRFATTVINSQSILSATSFLSMGWLMEGTLVTETISIWYFSIIFTGKLVRTLWNRRRNGWKQWSAVRILAAMGGCTMVIPSIFAILEYTTPEELPEAGTLALTMVALLLPLSSLWAGMATDEETSSLDLSHLTKSNQLSGSRTGYQQRNCGGSSNAPSSQSVLQSRKGSDSTQQATTTDSVVNSQGRDSTEMDLEAMGVRVKKSYGFQNA
ncbi:hypothetical protein CJF31_00000814 [Rutstroemia sp. NJR-2017a BVV2]|nr:hypothetical protein CJF31_00000814 [Rutstroemia sp. NJR-2017a BVV2]